MKITSRSVSRFTRFHGRCDKPIPLLLSSEDGSLRALVGSKGCGRRSIFLIVVPKILTNPVLVLRLGVRIRLLGLGLLNR